MRRFGVPIVLFVIGVLLIVLSVANVLPGLTGAGSGLVFLALVLLGLSFIPKPEGASDKPPMSAPETLLNVFFSPAETFQNLRRNPRWLAPLLVISILGSIYMVAFSQRVTPERIGNFMTDKIMESPFKPPDEMASKMREDNIKQYKEPLRLAGTAVNGFVGSFVGFSLVAALYLIIIMAMGGRINFWQALSATVYSWFAVLLIHRVLSLIILFLRDPADLHPLRDQQTLVTDNLGVLLTPANSPVLWVLASSIGLLSLYQLWLAATGLKNAGEKVSGGAAWTAALIVWFMGISLAAVSAALFPGFLS
jgi:hypothetical protein